MNKEESKKIYGKNLKRLRQAKGMSQEELAHALGFKNRSSINKIEIGRSNIPTDLITKTAEVLEVSPLELFKTDIDYFISQVKDIDEDIQKSIDAVNAIEKSMPNIIVETKKLEKSNNDIEKTSGMFSPDKDIEELMLDITKLDKKRLKLLKAYVRGLLDAQEEKE